VLAAAAALALAAAGCEGGGEAVPLGDLGGDGAVAGDADAHDAAADAGDDGKPAGDAPGDAGDAAAPDSDEGLDVATDGPADAKNETGCTPACQDNECGDDGCGDVCGYCQHGWECQSNLCVQTCFPDCEGKPDCASDGCLGYCGKNCP
jgi:hypothetical protein